jgi:small subunit ribosomal protein S17
MAHTIKGKVISIARNKTVTILHEQRMRHPRYEKIITRSRKIHAHSENPVSMGDVVEIVSCSPISKTKHYRVVAS